MTKPIAQSQLPFFEVRQKHSRRTILIVQADGVEQALARALLVVDHVDTQFDIQSEPWVVRGAVPPYRAATFADGYFKVHNLEIPPTFH